MYVLKMNGQGWTGVGWLGEYMQIIIHDIIRLFMKLENVAFYYMDPVFSKCFIVSKVLSLTEGQNIHFHNICVWGLLPWFFMHHNIVCTMIPVEAYILSKNSDFVNNDVLPVDTHSLANYAYLQDLWLDHLRLDL